MPNDPASVECKNHPSAALPRQSFSFRFREILELLFRHRFFHLLGSTLEAGFWPFSSFCR
jgi:hypothetical protein